MSSPQVTPGMRSGMETFWRGMFDPRNLEDPYPAYAQLRDLGRVLKPPVGGDLAPWLVSGYDEVDEVLRDTRFSSARRGPMLMRGSAELAERYSNQGGFGASMIFSDPPEHTRLRGLVSKAFTPRRISGMRARLEEIVDQLLAPVASRGGIELMDEFAGPLPATVIGDLLGVPPEDQERFRRWSNELFTRMGPPREGAASGPAAGLALGKYLSEIIAARRKAPKDDLISGMIAAQEERQVLTDAELLSTSLLLLIAGFETTTNLIGNGVLALLRHPEQLERLRADRALLPTAIEEFLRYDSPAQLIVRSTSEPLELGGQQLPAKAPVMLLLAAANRDPKQFSDPDRLDVGRKENAHLAFGWGVHHCLGAPLARLEAEVAFGALLDRFPVWRADPAAIARRPNPMLRGLARLPLTF